VKQQAYLVLFTTNTGKLPMTDLEMRAGGLQVVVRLAKLCNLSRVVFACETLIMCPRLNSYVKRARLSCPSLSLSLSVSVSVSVSLCVCVCVCVERASVRA
jgi:glycerophosphodiester phosphodiesterase